MKPELSLFITILEVAMKGKVWLDMGRFNLRGVIYIQMRHINIYTYIMLNPIYDTLPSNN